MAYTISVKIKLIIFITPVIKWDALHLINCSTKIAQSYMVSELKYYINPNNRNSL